MWRRVDRRDADDACPVGMGGGGLRMPNLCALTTVPRGRVSRAAVLGRLIAAVRLWLSGRPAGCQGGVNEARYAVGVGSEGG